MECSINCSYYNYSQYGSLITLKTASFIISPLSCVFDISLSTCLFLNFINKVIFLSSSKTNNKICSIKKSSSLSHFVIKELPQVGIHGLTSAWFFGILISCGNLSFSFLNQRTGLFHQFWKILNHYLLKCHLCSIVSLPSFWNSN